MKFIFALWVTKLLNRLIAIISPERGSNLSGEWALKIDSKFLTHFTGIDRNRMVFITGTNGKSSTTNLIAHIIRERGYKVISNLEGANLLPGICTILLKNSTLSGKIKADYLILETDERSLPGIYEQLQTKHLLVTNIQKDQVQRNGDPDYIYQKIKSIVNDDVTLYLNNHEPRCKSLEDFTKSRVYFGVEKNVETFMKSADYPTMACPKCQHGVDFQYYNVDNVGPFECPNCGFKSNDTVDYLTENIDYENKTFTIHGVGFTMPYDLACMAYNYASALAVIENITDISLEEASNTFEKFSNLPGRYESIKYKDKTIKYMRVKQENPDTLQTALNNMAIDKEDKMLCLGLCLVDDVVPSYMNTFYAFDCDFSLLANSNVESYYCFDPYVCYDTQNRLLLEGIDPALISVDESDDPAVIFKAIDKSKAKNIYLITLLATYLKMKEYASKEDK